MTGPPRWRKSQSRRSEPWAELTQTALSSLRAFSPAAMTPINQLIPNVPVQLAQWPQGNLVEKLLAEVVRIADNHLICIIMCRADLR